MKSAFSFPNLLTTTTCHVKTDAAAQFHEAKRADLAVKEEKEANLLSTFLPPLMSSEDIDSGLKTILANLPAGTDPKRSLGLALKEFYLKVDKSAVDASLVKKRAQALASSILPA